MKTKSLWPLTTVLVMMILGAMALEVAARDRGTKTLVIRIDESVSDETDESEDDWNQQAPINADHARARILAQRGDFAAALAVTKELVIADTTGNAGLNAEYGHLLRRAGELTDARRVLDAAIQATPTNAAVLVDLALIDSAQNHDKAAEEHLARALKIRPFHTASLLFLGRLQAKRGDSKSAIATLEKAARQGSNEDRARGLAALGRVRIEAGELPAARLDLNGAIERAPSNVGIWIAVARAYLRSTEVDDHKKALEHALKAAALAPGTSRVHALLASTFEKLGRQDEEISELERALNIDPGYVFVHEKLAHVFMDLNDYKKARKHAAWLCEHEPDSRESAFLLASVDLKSEQFDEAFKGFQKALELANNTYPEAWYNIGLVERKRGNFESSITAYQTAIAQRPGYLAGWNNLGLVLADAGREEEALQAYQTAIDTNPKYRAAWLNIGRLHYANDRFQEAATCYQKVVALSPDDRSANIKLGIALRKAGRTQDAIAAYKTLVERDPRYALAWYNLGVVYNSVGKTNEAQIAFETALTNDPNHLNSMKSLGAALAKSGNLEAAKSHLKNALEHEPGDLEARHRLASVYAGLGDSASCESERARVISQQPEHEARNLNCKP
jgi:tetratricopeptide (TPR) repeat protein